MTLDFSAAMRRALQLTRAQNVMEATRVIQRALTGRGRAAPPPMSRSQGARLLAPPRDVAADRGCGRTAAADCANGERARCSS